MPPHLNRSRPLIAIVRIFVNALAFAVVAVGVGVGSAWYMMDYGTRFSTRSTGPWLEWISAGRTDGDPYARAHAARKGILFVTPTLETSYRANVDSAGGAINASCDYVIALDGFAGGWWSIAAYASKGQLIPNAADRYAFNTSTVMRETDGRAIITLARDARPGNWLPIGGGSQINVVLTVQNPVEQDGGAQRTLPEIQRVGCR